MEDRFIDGDHSEFNYRSSLRKEEADGNALVADALSQTATDDIASGGDPHAHGLGGDLKSAVVGIVKGMVGPAILYLPHGFAQAGWVIAVPMLFASTALYLASSASLLECWEVETKNNKRMLQLEGNMTNIREGRHTVLEMKELRKSSNIRNNIDASTDGSNTPEDFENEFLDGALVSDNGENPAHATRRRFMTSAATTPSYPDLAKKAYGSRGQTIVKIGIAAMQSGVCLTYLIFVPQNMRSSCRALFGMDVSTSVFLLFMVIIQIPLSWIRDIRHLTVTNALANSLIMYGLITCLGFAFQNAIAPIPINGEQSGGEGDEMESENGNFADSERGPIAEILYKFFNLTSFNSSGWFLFIGTSVLLFEGSITLLIPLQEAVATPQDRQYFPNMYPNVILCIIWFYTFFGIFCWMSFGDEVRTVMTTSLPEHSALATTVQLAYSVAVMLTFPLQNFPSLEIACTAIESELVIMSASTRIRSNKNLFGLLQIVQRREVISSLLVCALALVAILTMDRLDKVVSLMGGLLGCPLAFVFPPLIHNKLASMAPGSGLENSSGRSGGYYLSNRRRLQNKIVATLGLGAMIVATIATILKW
jgi:proton-coupled amino acid transporter